MRLARGPVAPVQFGVRVIDLRDNPRIAIMRDMLIDVSRATTQYEVMAALAARLWKLRPVDHMISISRRGLPDGRYKVTRRMRRNPGNGVPENIGPADPWRAWNDLPTHSGGFLGAMIATPEPKLVHDLGLVDDPVLGASLADMGSCMAVPLYDRGEPTYWTFSFRREPRAYTVDDLEQNMLTGNLVGGTNRQLALLNEVNRLNAQVMAQFEEIARVQRSLLPATEPRIPGLAIRTSYLTSQQAGGDYYDFFELPDGRWGFFVADVSGHGAGAATVMAMLHAIIRGYENRERFEPHDVLPYINRRLVQSGLAGMFVTAVLAAYDPATARLTFSRAGHPAPRLKEGRTGRVRSLDGAATVPLGVLDPFESESAMEQLGPGDTVVLYTDGITEAFSPSRQMFGVAGLDAALDKCTGDPACVVDSVQGALHVHTGGRLDRDDDQTLVVFRRAEDGR